MADNLFSTVGGLSFPVTCRNYGSQDKGVSPEGAQDQLSFDIAYNIFKQPKIFQAIEMLYPAKIIALEDILFIIGGAKYQSILTDEGTTITKDCIYKLTKGQTITFSGAKQGFRTLVFAIESSLKDCEFIGKVRSKSDSEIITKLYADRFIRVVKGPEYSILVDDSLFIQEWTISQNSSQMGLVLDGDNLARQELEMISQPVVDGTVQLSPNGPIVLMRHRQTVGGYPRIVNVIEPDISKLAQFAIGESFRFKLIDLKNIVEAKKQSTHAFSQKNLYNSL